MFLLEALYKPKCLSTSSNVKAYITIWFLLESLYKHNGTPYVHLRRSLYNHSVSSRTII